MDRDSVLLTEAEASKAFATVFQKVLRLGKTVGEAMSAGLENMAHEEAKKLMRFLKERCPHSIGADAHSETLVLECEDCMAEISAIVELE